MILIKYIRLMYILCALRTEVIQHAQQFRQEFGGVEARFEGISCLAQFVELPGLTVADYAIDIDVLAALSIVPATRRHLRQTLNTSLCEVVLLRFGHTEQRCRLYARLGAIT